MGFVDRFTGKTAAKAAKQAGNIQSDAAISAAGDVTQAGQQAGALLNSAGTNISNRLGVAGDQASGIIGNAGQQAGALLNPFAQIGQQGVDQAGFLTDPQAQFDFLQNNPLFQLGLDNANTQTNQFAAARGRLSAGDTLQQLNNNALLTASPLIQQQKQSIGDLLNLGSSTTNNQANILQNTGLNQANILQNTAGNQASTLQNSANNQANILQQTAGNAGNLLTGAAAAQAGGLVGAENARSAGLGNILNLGSQIGGFAFGGV